MNEDNSPKEVIIYVNGQAKPWDKKEISYAEVVELAFPGSDKQYTVTYTEGDHEKQLVPSSKPVHARDGMEFDVDETSNS